MIIGLGSDLIDIRRIERSLERHGHRFANRVFTKMLSLMFNAGILSINLTFGPSLCFIVNIEHFVLII